jgi:hypothetical protein
VGLLDCVEKCVTGFEVAVVELEDFSRACYGTGFFVFVGFGE